MTSRLIQLIQFENLRPGSKLGWGRWGLFRFRPVGQTCQWKTCWNSVETSYSSVILQPKSLYRILSCFNSCKAWCLSIFPPHHWGYSLAKSLMTETPEFNCENFARRRIRQIFPRMARLSRSTMPVVIVEPLLVLYLGHHVILHTNSQHDNMIYQTDINKQYSWWHTQIPNCKLQKLAKNHHDRLLSG